MTSPVELSFQTSVPAHLQDDVMQRICEAAWGSTIEGVTIIDGEKWDALNVEASGTVLVEGVERWFHIRDGNNAGTELIGWEDRGAGIEREPREPQTLVPHPGMVDHAISQGRGAAFLEEWDSDLDPRSPRGAKLARLPAAAAYDAFFAPGTGASQAHHERAREAGYTIGEMGEAIRLRSRLIASFMTFAPHWGSVMESCNSREDRCETLRLWDEALDRESTRGGRLGSLVDGLVARLAADPSPRRFPTAEEHASFTAEGYVICNVATARRFREELLRPLLSLEPIEGFDPARLPENPIAVLFQTLDPALVSSTRVNPDTEGARLLESVARRLAREPGPAISDAEQQAAVRIGFRINFAWKKAPAAEPAGPQI